MRMILDYDSPHLPEIDTARLAHGICQTPRAPGTPPRPQRQGTAQWRALPRKGGRAMLAQPVREVGGVLQAPRTHEVTIRVGLQFLATLDAEHAGRSTSSTLRGSSALPRALGLRSNAIGA